MQTRRVLQAAAATSSLAEAERAAREVARELRARLGGPVKAVICFATTCHGPAYDRIGRILDEVLRPEHIVGCSAAGVLGDDREIEGGAGIAALALAGEFEARRFFIPSLRGRAEQVGHELGRMAGAIERPPRTVILLADSYNLAPDELLSAVTSVEPTTRVLGCGASEDGSIGETSVFARSAVSSNAVAGLVLGGVRVRSLITQACHPVGPWRTITRAENNRIVELDGKPALHGYLEVLPALLRSDLEQALRATRGALAIELGPDEIAPPYLVRGLIGADARSGTLTIADEVYPGMRFAVAIRDPGAARQSLAAGLARLAASGPPLAGAVYFNCVGRGRDFYGLPGIDTAYIRQGLGNVPLTGLFCGAELAPVGGMNRLQQYSGVLVGFEASIEA